MHSSYVGFSMSVIISRAVEIHERMKEVLEEANYGSSAVELLIDEAGCICIEEVSFVQLLEMNISLTCRRLGLTVRDILIMSLRDLGLRVNIPGIEALCLDGHIPKVVAMSAKSRYSSALVLEDEFKQGIAYYTARGIPIPEEYVDVSIRELRELSRAISLVDNMKHFGLQPHPESVNLEDTDISNAPDLT